MVSAEQKTLHVEVAYALPEEQVILGLDVKEGTTLEQAIQRSGILQQFPDIDISGAKLGIFGKISKPGTPLRDRDRVEIYRPLIADPKQVRKQRAAEGKRMRKGGGDVEEGEADENPSAQSAD